MKDEKFIALGKGRGIKWRNGTEKLCIEIFPAKDKKEFMIFFYRNKKKTALRLSAEAVIGLLQLL